MMYNKSTNYQFNNWYIETNKGRILASQGEQRERYENEIKLPHLPDMLFADNYLRLTHKSGFGIEFNALDALKLVDPSADLIKVSVAKEWQESRTDCEFIDKLVRPFDWTFTTNYKGSFIGDKKLAENPTSDRINMEKLKIPETISFFDEISLFDDELSDHGISCLNVKIRVMPTSFYILQRFFLRVDNVVIRCNDTRLYHEAQNNFLIREYSERESLVKNLDVTPKTLSNINELSNILELKHTQIEKLQFP
ncbi:TIP41 [Brachionus plicatilis]|uniref:TIP41-like protein n=1 Tax=Brachionus plicatilis TaxID=10195 RepID=A0A3M7STD9_BRAPC|nr:TIP41 [Brachionus plicatilis]